MKGGHNRSLFDGKPIRSCAPFILLVQFLLLILKKSDNSGLEMNYMMVREMSTNVEQFLEYRSV